MNRLEAIQLLRAGKEIHKTFDRNYYGVERDLVISIYNQKKCSFSMRRIDEHKFIGPIEVRLWSGNTPHWIHINCRQLLTFIKRNYERKL